MGLLHGQGGSKDNSLMNNQLNSQIYKKFSQCCLRQMHNYATIRKHLKHDNGPGMRLQFI